MRRVALLSALLSCTLARPAAPPPAPPARAPVQSAVTGPLVLAVHATRPALDLGVELARAVVAGAVRDWQALGEPRAPLRLVLGPTALAAAAPPAGAGVAPSDAEAVTEAARDPDVVAVVGAAALRPVVRAVAVEGVHPLRAPGRYPLRAPGPAPPGPVVTVTLVGDVMLGRRVARAAAGDPAAPFRHVAARLAAADLTVGNLECTLSRAGAPRQGDDSFAADPAAVAGLRAAGFDVVSLANNHAGDFGPRALAETLDRLRAAGIAPVGAGRDEVEARAPVVVERAGVRFGFLAFNAIGETPAARPGRPGAVRIRMRPRTGPLHRGDLDRFLADVRALRPRVDVLVVLPHWGEQYSRRLHPDQRAVARALVDAGADLVVGSHSHWVQGAFVEDGRLVFPSLGNFVFDQDFSLETRQGLALELVFWGPTLVAADIHPTEIGPGFAPRFLAGDRARRVLAAARASSGAPFSGAGS
jgi:poly-gamma-glutamate capsule biosynthesis protein CapA/YwtB (metallophosphatase superfamily)